jgi:hypothetical protein
VIRLTVFTRPGWLQNAGAVHSAEQMRNYAGAMLIAGSGGSGSMQSRGGVHTALGFEMQVVAAGSPSMNVVVRSGLCAIPGTEGAQQGTYGLGNDGDVTLAISAAHATLARIDLVIARIRDTAYSGGADTGVLEVVTGTPAGSPVAPVLPANSLELGRVTVAALATSITNGNISMDNRRFLAAVGGVISAKSTDSHVNLLSTGQPVYDTDTGRFKLATDNGTNFKTVFTGVNVQKFTSGGTWNKPVGAQRVRIRVQAGGGGGGASNAASAGENSKGGGGGGGGYSESWLDASALAATVAVTVGAGGASSSNGGNSSFGAHVTANGGSAGGTAFSSSAPGFAAQGGAGGAAGTGDIAVVGGGGGMGNGSGNLAGSGPGGSSVLGGGASGRSTGGVGSSFAGTAGGVYGGGGGGALSSSTGGAASGGAGAAGIVIVETFGV